MERDINPSPVVPDQGREGVDKRHSTTHPHRRGKWLRDAVEHASNWVRSGLREGLLRLTRAAKPKVAPFSTDSKPMIGAEDEQPAYREGTEEYLEIQIARGEIDMDIEQIYPDPRNEVYKVKGMGLRERQEVWRYGRGEQYDFAEALIAEAETVRTVDEDERQSIREAVWGKDEQVDPGVDPKSTGPVGEKPWHMEEYVDSNE